MLLNMEFLDRMKLAAVSWVETIHANIIQQERTVINLQLAIAFQRGQLYINARRFVPSCDLIKEWYSQQFELSYITVQRYITLAMLIQNFPRLMLCTISLTQIIKHQNRIKKYLATDYELANKLKLDAQIFVQNKSLQITPVESQTIATS